MIYKHFTKEQINELEIEDTGHKFASTIAIFKHKNQVLLFDTLDDEKYKIHPASQVDFAKLNKEQLENTTK